MLTTFVVVWRESLEAAVMVAILLAYLRRIGHRDKFRYIYLGVAAALALCAVFAWLSGYIDEFFEGAGSEVLAAVIMAAAVGVVTMMVLWMHRQAGNLRGALESQAGTAIAQGQLYSLAALAAIAVFREGTETVLFLWGVVLGSHSSGLHLLAGGIAGASAALVMAFLLYRGAAYFNLKLFFQGTAIILLFIAAGMLAQAVNKLIGVGWLPPVVGQLWNSSWLLDERTVIGSLAAAVLGYRSRPSLLEVAAYATYFAVVLFAMRRGSHAQAQPS